MCIKSAHFFSILLILRWINSFDSNENHNRRTLNKLARWLDLKVGRLGYIRIERAHLSHLLIRYRLNVYCFYSNAGQGIRRNWIETGKYTSSLVHICVIKLDSRSFDPISENLNRKEESSMDNIICLHPYIKMHYRVYILRLLPLHFEKLCINLIKRTIQEIFQSFLFR
jgi:hypothetical protein